jgi:hypothetical protein
VSPNSGIPITGNTFTGPFDVRAINLGYGPCIANDNCDFDTGANDSRNFPVVTSARPTVAGTLNSHPKMTFTIEAIGGPTGQPMRPLGTTTVTTGGAQ